MSDIIRTEGLTKSFKTKCGRVDALRSIDMNVAEGEFVMLLGKSGCGKSTLLNIIGFMDSPDGGKYYFDGEDVSSLSNDGKADYRAKRLGFIFQQFNLIYTMTAFENVELPLGYAGVEKSARREKVERMLKKVGIGDRADHLPSEMSGGEQQRCAIARALIMEPKLILADEPTGNLDEDSTGKIMQLLKEINAGGTAILMVTHDTDLTVYSDRIIKMKAGMISDETE